MLTIQQQSVLDSLQLFSTCCDADDTEVKSGENKTEIHIDPTAWPVFWFPILILISFHLLPISLTESNRILSSSSVQSCWAPLWRRSIHLSRHWSFVRPGMVAATWIQDESYPATAFRNRSSSSAVQGPCFTLGSRDLYHRFWHCVAVAFSDTSRATKTVIRKNAQTRRNKEKMDVPNCQLSIP